MHKKLFKSLVVIVLLIMGITTTFAVPANKKPVTIKQPNGKTLTFILQGDERVHWAVTLDGYSLVKTMMAISSMHKKMQAAI